MKTAQGYFSEHFDEARKWRRKLHRHAQSAWVEFYATGFVAEKLSAWGYEVQLGEQIVAAGQRSFVPAGEVLADEYQKALDAGIKEAFIAPAQEGLTGVVGILRGRQPGPTVAFRFDIDSNQLMESQDRNHRAAAEGYASSHPGYAHMCGHDVHTAMGLLLAGYFAGHADQIKGSVKFIFQPDEEKISGAAAMTAAGVVDDVDYLLGGHVGITLTETGQVALNVKDFLALTRSEITFTGKASHSGVRPDLGRNALLGACTAITSLHAIARHGLGASRINVGVIQGGTAWNVVPETTTFWLETRAVTNEINRYMQERARDILDGAAKMYGLELEITEKAHAPAGANSQQLVGMGTEVARRLPWVKEVVPEISFNASEDFMVMSNAVQKRGGKAVYVLHGTPVGGGHHSNTFEVDETVIRNGADFFAAYYQELVK